MKLPQDIEGIYREGRTDAFTSAGVEASGLWGRIKRGGRWLWKRRKKAMCLAKCVRAPGGRIGKAACAARCVI